MMNLKKYLRDDVGELEEYPLLRKFKNGFTEKINTNPFLEGYAAYPDGQSSELRDQFSEYTNKYNGTMLKKENIIFTAGCTEGIELLIRAHCMPRAESVGVFYPNIYLFEDIAQKNLVNSQIFWLKGENLNMIPDVLLPSECKIIFICNPGNPIGSVISLNEIREFSKKSETIVAVDETYIDFTDSPSAVELLSECENIVVLKSFSKYWGLAGLRAGAVVAHPDIISALRALQLPFSVNAVALEEIKSRLENSIEPELALASINKEKALLIKTLEKAHSIAKIYPSSTNFIFIRMKDKCPYENLLKMSEFHITDFGNQVPYGIRISLSDRESNRTLRDFIINNL